MFKRNTYELAEDLCERGKNDIRDMLIDGTLTPEKKGAFGVGNTKHGKGTKIMAVADTSGLPIATHMESASQHKVKLVAATIPNLGIEMIAPNRGNCKKPRTRDGCNLSR